jgi:pilus assembly protein Flp/PilA
MVALTTVEGILMRALLSNLMRDRSGATAVEYGLIAGLIAVVILAGVQLLGQRLLALFNTIAGAI